MINETNGQTSSSRVLALTGSGSVGFLFLIVMVGLFFNAWEWARFDGALSWGRDFVFVTILPYIGNVASKAIGKKNGNVDH